MSHILQFSELTLRRLDMNLLLVFSAIMREGSVERAAQRLSLGGPATSMALSRLRKAIGDDLFVRANGRMEPTSRALEFWSAVAPALGSIETAVTRARHFVPENSDRVFRLVVPDDLEFVIVPMLLDRLPNRAPRARLVVRPSDFRSSFARLHENNADLSLAHLAGETVGAHLRMSRLFQDSFSVVFDAAAVGCDVPLSFGDYLNTPHLLISPTGVLEDEIDTILAARGRHRSLLAAVAHYPTVPFLLKNRRALANVPTTAAKYMSKAYGLGSCLCPVKLAKDDVGLVWHVRTNADAADIWFRSLVREVVLAVASETVLPKSKTIK